MSLIYYLKEDVICPDAGCLGCEHGDNHKYAECDSSCEGGGDHNCPACVEVKGHQMRVLLLTGKDKEVKK